MGRGPNKNKRCDGKFDRKVCQRVARHRFMDMGFCDRCWNKWEELKDADFIVQFIEDRKCHGMKTYSEAPQLL